MEPHYSEIQLKERPKYHFFCQIIKRQNQLSRLNLKIGGLRLPIMEMSITLVFIVTKWWQHSGSQPVTNSARKAHESFQSKKGVYLGQFIIKDIEIKKIKIQAINMHKKK